MSVHASQPANDKIAALAHKFWEDEGRPEGRAEIHWQRAAAELAVTKKSAAPKVSATKTAAKKSVKSKA